MVSFAARRHRAIHRGGLGWERRLCLGDFVANVSHELKTPLSLVRMFGELLLEHRVQSEEKQRQYLHIIVSESERLTALIENVLDFAKVERGKAAYEPARDGRDRRGARRHCHAPSG
jgi:signal transduction histidine kinase